MKNQVVFNKYVFRKYSKNFPILFRKEKNKLQKILTKEAIIQHVGSTAIKGLGGKGIIDISIAVNKKNIEKNKKILEKEGYIFHVIGSTRERKFFDKQYGHQGTARRVHLHLTFHNSFESRKALVFVKYLNTHPKKMREYARIKKEGIKFAKGEGKKYRNYKNKFLEKTAKEALKEFKETL